MEIIVQISSKERNNMKSEESKFTQDKTAEEVKEIIIKNHCNVIGGGMSWFSVKLSLDLLNDNE
ncbi:hypothetical protein D3C79_1073920 [compost metagenome]